VHDSESEQPVVVVDPQEELRKAILENQLDVVWGLVESGKCGLLDENLVWRLMRDHNLDTTMTIMECILKDVSKLIKEPHICRAVIKEVFIQLLKHLVSARSPEKTAELLRSVIQTNPELKTLVVQHCFVYGKIPNLQKRLSDLDIIQKNTLPPLKHLNFFISKKLIPGIQVYSLLLEKYTKEQVFREIIYFLPAYTIHRLAEIESGRDIYKEGSTIETEGEAKLARLMNEDSFNFYKFFIAEFPRESPAKWKSLTRPVAVEERFWFNCLFDNMAGLMVPSDGHVGSVIIDEKNQCIKEMLFPHYNNFYLGHAERVWGRVNFENNQERARFDTFFKHLNDLNESGKRFLEPETYNDIVCKKLRELKVGESYALDIYLRESTSEGQGHLIIGIVRVVEGKGYCLRIINTGWGSPRMEGFCARYVLYTDFEGIALEQIIEQYITRQSTLADLTPKCSNKVIHHTSFATSGRGQYEGTCSLERIAAMCKLDLTPPDSYDLGLYME